jgi:hypothetical protein
MSMKAYKHVRLDDAHFLEKGSFRLRTLDAMRRAELGVLKDEREGIQIGKLKKYLVQPGYTSPLFIENVKHMIPGIDHPENIILFENCGFEKEALDQWIFCMTSQPDRRAFPEYGATFKIKSVSAFARSLWRSASDRLGEPKIEVVSYRDDTDLDAELMISSPFVKRMEFAKEKEIRIAWPIVSCDAEVLDISSAEALRSIERINH